MSKIMLADGVEFTIGMSLHSASNARTKEEKTSDETHYIKGDSLYRRKPNGDVEVPGYYIAEWFFSTRNAALDSEIAKYDRQIARLQESRAAVEAAKQ